MTSLDTTTTATTNPTVPTAPAMAQPGGASKEPASEEGDTCAICLSTLDGAANPMVLPCQHIYHRTCIAEWAKVNPSCPTCRTTFNAPNLLSPRELTVDLTGPSRATRPGDDDTRYCSLCEQDMGTNEVELPLCSHAFCRDCLRQNAHHQRRQVPELDLPGCPICGAVYGPEPILGEYWPTTQRGPMHRTRGARRGQPIRRPVNPPPPAALMPPPRQQRQQQQVRRLPPPAGILSSLPPPPLYLSLSLSLLTCQPQ